MNFHEAIAFAKKTKGARITCTFWKQCDGLKDLRYLYYDEHGKPVLIGIDPDKNLIHDYAFNLLYLLDKEWEVFADPVYTQNVVSHLTYDAAMARLLQEMRGENSVFISNIKGELDIYSYTPIFVAHNPRTKISVLMGSGTINGQFGKCMLEYHHLYGLLRIYKTLPIDLDLLNDVDERDWEITKIFKTEALFTFKEICQYCNFNKFETVYLMNVEYKRSNF